MKVINIGLQGGDMDIKETKKYTLIITEEEFQIIKNDITLKAMSGKLEFDDTAYTIGKIIHKQIINKDSS